MEEKFDKVKEDLYKNGKLPDDIAIAMRDPSQVTPLLPSVEHTLEAVTLP